MVRWLRGRVPLEPDDFARNSAVQALGEAGLDPETEADLRHWARRDPSGFVRQAAADYYSGRPCPKRTSQVTGPDRSHP